MNGLAGKYRGDGKYFLTKSKFIILIYSNYQFLYQRQNSAK